MIKYHPSDILLANFSSGDLPASIAIGVSIHCQMCPTCQAEVDKLTDKLAGHDFNLDFDVEFDAEFASTLDSEIEGSESNPATTNDIKPMTSMDFGNMIDAITANDEISEQTIDKTVSIDLRGKPFELPKQLNNVGLSNWLNIGKLSRTSLDLDEGHVHSHLIHIAAGGEVPTHTHKGFEITLLLDGSFSDHMDTYHKGDFIELSSEHNHKPKTAYGCLCYTVADDALHFTEGFHKIFNPIGNLLY